MVSAPSRPCRARSSAAAELLLQITPAALLERWQALLDHARRRGVQVIGDLPFYVAHDSADVWSHRRLFSTTAAGRLRQQSGVPPDYFSATGQLWGTPVYRWPLHRLTRFRWWLRRLQRQLELFDLLRLDHFRALEAAWCVPGGDSTAENGVWKPSPGWSLLRKLRRRLARARGSEPLPLIAEDLGVITPAVERLRDGFALPGMKILQFAFDGNADNPYLPDNFQGSHWLVYTGTHDNATCIGWWQGLPEEQRQQVQVEHVGRPLTISSKIGKHGRREVDTIGNRIVVDHHRKSARFRDRAEMRHGFMRFGFVRHTRQHHQTMSARFGCRFVPMKRSLRVGWRAAPLQI